jgi:hypothetical protein
MVTKKTHRTSKQKTIDILRWPYIKTRSRADSFFKRRPHRSFRRTRRRDYKRSLKLPNYWAFSIYVFKTLWKHRRLFLMLVVVYAILTVLLVGITSQDTYSTITNTLNETGEGLFNGGWGQVGRAGLLFITAITGNLSQTPTETQQVYTVLISLLTWLTTVWLLRNIMAGHKVKLRDGIYSAAAPFVSTLMVFLVFILQLLPLALALIAYSAAQASGFLAGGIEAMLFWAAAGLLALISLYWLTSTFIALVVVTLPGMYPFQALKIAGDMVVGRRLRLLLRFLWMILNMAVIWAIIMIPIILFDSWLKNTWSAVEWLPIVPVLLLVMSSFSIVWISSYVYLLYRKVVADDSKPA